MTPFKIIGIIACPRQKHKPSDYCLTSKVKFNVATWASPTARLRQPAAALTLATCTSTCIIKLWLLLWSNRRSQAAFRVCKVDAKPATIAVRVGLVTSSVRNVDQGTPWLSCCWLHMLWVLSLYDLSMLVTEVVMSTHWRCDCSWIVLLVLLSSVLLSRPCTFYHIACCLYYLKCWVNFLIVFSLDTVVNFYLIKTLIY